MLTLGAGAAISISTKQKLVARSFTEAKLIGVYDAMPQILWTRHFLQEQQYDVKEVILYQDNRSTMLPEQNGRASSSKRTKHICIRYFYVKDHVDKKNIQIVHCPTEQMLADFYTKPLQGSLFFKMRDLIMNIQPSNPLHSSQSLGRSVLIQDALGVFSTRGQTINKCGSTVGDENAAEEQGDENAAEEKENQEPDKSSFLGSLKRY